MTCWVKKDFLLSVLPILMDVPLAPVLCKRSKYFPLSTPSIFCQLFVSFHGAFTEKKSMYFKCNGMGGGPMDKIYIHTHKIRFQHIIDCKYLCGSGLEHLLGMQKGPTFPPWHLQIKRNTVLLEDQLPVLNNTEQDGPMVWFCIRQLMLIPNQGALSLSPFYP